MVSDTRFLSPFSDFAGVGVDVFLFLSGFGLATSAIRKQLSVKEFYQKRLGKIFLPLWITLSLFLLADYFILHKTYPIGDTIINFFGIFRHADIFIKVSWELHVPILLGCIRRFYTAKNVILVKIQYEYI